MKKTILTIFSGTVGAQLIGLISIPLLMSHYEKSDFAEYTAFFAISSIIGNFTSLKLGNFIFSIEKEYISKLTKFLLLFSVALFLVLFPLVYFYSPEDYRLLITLSLFNGMAIGIYDYFYACSVRFAKTKTYALSRFLRVFLELLVILSVIYINLNVYYFMFLCASSYFVTAFFCFQSIYGDLKAFKIAKKINLREEINIIAQDFFASVFNVIAIYIPILYFYFSKDDYYSTAFFLVARFVGTPALIVAQSIGTALKQHAIEEYEQTGNCVKSINYIWFNFIKKLLPIYVLLILIGYVLAYYLSHLYGGQVFLNVVFIMLPLYFFRYLFNCLAAIVYILRLQKVNMYYQFLLLILPSMALFFSGSPLFSLMGYSILSIIIYLIYFVFVLKKGNV